MTCEEDISCFSDLILNNIQEVIKFNEKKIIILELFCGTKSVSNTCQKVFNKNNCNIVTLDLNNRFNPNIEIDIIELDFERLFKKHAFDIIWASPECTEYSLCKTTQQRDILTSNKVVAYTMSLIKYLSPKYYFIENPSTGFLKDQEIMNHIPYYDVSYCMYSDYGYKKNTRIWTNIKKFNALQCTYINRCKHFINNKHACSVQELSKFDKYRVPEKLIFELLKCTTFVPKGTTIVIDKKNDNNEGKKKRGRPPKSIQEIALSDDKNIVIDKKNDYNEGKKKRGRPPKNIQEIALSDDKNKYVGQDKKRKRGRPSKNI